MSNRLSQILSSWKSQKDQLQWVLGTVVNTDGPSYRNTGAMMMINSLGQWQGLLSGGCLENDLLRHAREVIQSGCSKRVTYDALDDDTSWLLGIGCGGKVEILLQPVNHQNHYLQLQQVLCYLNQHTDCYYQIDLKSQHNRVGLNSKAQQPSKNSLEVLIKADPLVVIFGGGVDAIPLTRMAKQLGWNIHLVDHRVSHARESDFSHLNNIIHAAPEQLLERLTNHDNSLNWLTQCDAAIVMTHNLSQDAAVLNLLSSLSKSRLKYIGLLGPDSRKQKVLLMANLNEALLPTLLHGPMGFDIGGELPESIALSILAEIHAVLEKKSVIMTHPLPLNGGLES